MSTTLDEQINQLKQTIADIESQRSILGDVAVDASLVPFYEKLAELEALAKSPIEVPSEIPVRQRKLVTLLYMDVVGSTAMTHDLDPEDTMEIMEKAILRLAAPIEAHGGHITRYTGDGFKAIFGDPISREDDPEQAIRASLKILEVSKAVAQEIEKDWGIENFQVRIGIDTGLAAIGGQTEAEDTVKGRVVNLAVRIESAAPPGGLLISHNTYRHVRGVFNVDPQEPITAKGFPEPVPVYLIREIKPRAFRVQTRGVEGVETRMIGRRTELDTLKDALLTTFEEGEGQVVTITGEAGVGKSRLLYEFQNWLELLPPTQDIRLFQGRARQEAESSPYSLLRDVFTFRFQITDDNTREEARNKIESGLWEVLGKSEDGKMKAHILGQLLGFDFSASPHMKGVLNDAEQLRNRGVMYLIQYFQAISQEIPVVIFLEDIHWADVSSLGVVNRLGEFTPEYPILIVCACRPQLFERRPYWGEGLEYHKLIELHLLSKRESRKLVSEILKLSDDIPADLRELVVQGAEGNPFYTEELIKMLIEDGVVIPNEETWQIDLTRLEEVDVPSTLAGVLQARLDSLPINERAVLQQASVVGRLFWDSIVSYIHMELGNGGDPQLVSQVLTSLRNRELIYRHEESTFEGAIEYLFKHDVLREVTYESVLKRLRKTYHGLVADWMIANCGDRIDEYNGLIADHLLIADRDQYACEYFFQAGESALASFANSEAESYYRHSLDLSPDKPLQADSLTGLGDALFRQGKSEQAEVNWRHSIALYQELGNSDRMADVYARLSALVWYHDRYQSWGICQEGLDLIKERGESQGHARLLAEGGRTALFSNRADQIVPLCEKAVEMAERVGDSEVKIEAKITMALNFDDVNQSIILMEEMAKLAESNSFMKTASRSINNLGAVVDNNHINLTSANRYYFQSAEIYNYVGDIQGLLLVMTNIHDCFVKLGQFNSVEEKMVRFFKTKNIPIDRKARFIKIHRPDINHARGEWDLALEEYKKIKNELHNELTDYEIYDINLGITSSILELDRFEFQADLDEAARCLLENVETLSTSWSSQIELVRVLIRLNRIEDAFDYYTRTCNLLNDSQSNLFIRSTEYRKSKIDFEFASINKEWEEAINICEAWIEKYQKGGYHWDLARSLIDLGDALVGRNQPGDLERARETYQQSLDMFTEMGAPGYIKVLEERLGEL